MRGILLAIVLGLVLAGCGSEAPSSVSGGAEPPAATSRPEAPVVEGTTVAGEDISLAELRGRPVFVNVWSSW